MDGDKKTATTLSYIFPMGNYAFHDRLKIFRDMTPHQDLFNTLQELVPIVANIEGLSELLIYQNLDGSENDKLMAQEIEGKRRRIYTNLQVTGFAVSDPNDELSAIITYKKIDKGLKITGAATASVNTTKNLYGIEVDLREIIDRAIQEVYEFIYNDKYIDEGQLNLGLFADAEKLEDAEQLKIDIESEDNQTVKIPKKKGKKIVEEPEQD
jgi:hypothetical protein